MINGYLLDANLSLRLVAKLEPVLNGVIHVSAVGAGNMSDKEIWSLAKDLQLVIVTKDNDFFYMSHLFGCPPRVIRLNCGNKSTTFIAGLLQASVKAIESFIAGENCYMEIL